MSKTVKVRIPVSINEKGHWQGGGGLVFGYDEAEAHRTAKSWVDEYASQSYVITVELPMPENVIEVAGEVKSRRGGS